MSDEKMFSVGVDPAERLQRDFIQKSEAVREQMTVNSHSEEDQGSSDCEKGTESAHEGPIGGVSYLPAETMVELQPDDCFFFLQVLFCFFFVVLPSSF